MSSQNRTEVLEALSRRADAHFAQTGIPFVTVTYAQSLDGSIAGSKGEPIRISCQESLTYTHALRACHEGILVGINTVLSDDPALSTRLVEGSNPRPVVLDSTLRIPLSAKLLQAESTRPIIFTTQRSDPQKREALREMNICVFEVFDDETGMISLKHALACLGQLGLRSLMVEGGGEVITSFLKSRLVDHLIITVSMQMIGGTNVLHSHLGRNGQASAFPVDLNPSAVRWEGVDMIVHGDPRWNDPE